MKNMKLFRAIGEVDSRYVEEAARPVRKMVWMPIVAAAACMALTVGLGFGLDRDPLPVEPAAPVTPSQSETTELTEPTESTQSTTRPTDTTADTTTTTTEKSTTTEKPTTGSTAKPTTTTTTAKPTTTTTTAKPTTVKPTTKTEPTKTTEKPTTTAKPTTTTNTTTARPTTTATTTITTATEPYILVGGEEPKVGISNSIIPSLKDRLVSKMLEEKMKEYRNVNAVFQVVVWSVFTSEDYHEFDKFLEADEEYQSLTKQYEEAKKAEKEASDRLHDAQVINANKNEPQIDVTPLEEEYRKAKKIYNELSEERSALRQELFEGFRASIKNERISHAARYSKTEPISGYGSYGNGYYMELTADAINELVDRGGYSFKLTTEKKREDAKYEAVNA